MDLRSTKYRLADDRLVPVEGSDARQGFLDQCVEAVLAARIALGLSGPEPTALENLLSTHLASVLLFGLRPDEARLREVTHGPWTVFERLRRAPGRAQRRRLALDSAQASLFLHGLRLLGRGGTRAGYGELAFVGRACYRCAADTLDGDDAGALTYRAVAERFSDCSDLLGQAAVELRFVDRIPPGLTE